MPEIGPTAPRRSHSGTGDQPGTRCIFRCWTVQGPSQQEGEASRGPTAAVRCASVPRSAGARPGPGRDGFGGDQPTVTDAHVVLAASRGSHPGVTIPLDPCPARLPRSGRLADTLRARRRDVRRRHSRGANNEIGTGGCGWSASSGRTPGSNAVIAFGGAGRFTPARVADRWHPARPGPATAGVLAALGAGDRRAAARLGPTFLPSRSLRTHPAAALGAEIRPGPLRDAPTVSCASPADCRFVGQSHSLTVPWDRAATPSPRRRIRDLHNAALRDADPDAPNRDRHDSDRRRAPRRAPRRRYPRRSAIPSGVRPLQAEMTGATLWIARGWDARRCVDGSFDMRRNAEAGGWTP